MKKIKEPISISPEFLTFIVAMGCFCLVYGTTFFFDGVIKANLFNTILGIISQIFSSAIFFYLSFYKEEKIYTCKFLNFRYFLAINVVITLVLFTLMFLQWGNIGSEKAFFIVACWFVNSFGYVFTIDLWRIEQFPFFTLRFKQEQFKKQKKELQKQIEGIKRELRIFDREIKEKSLSTLNSNNLAIKQAKEVKSKLYQECMILENMLVSLSTKIENIERQKEEISLIEKSKDLKMKTVKNLSTIKERINLLKDDLEYSKESEELENIMAKYSAIDSLKKQGLF